jgi:hypothetical protein
MLYEPTVAYWVRVVRSSVNLGAPYLTNPATIANVRIWR